jgi:hypothetical protein
MSLEQRVRDLRRHALQREQRLEARLLRTPASFRREVSPPLAVLRALADLPRREFELDRRISAYGSSGTSRGRNFDTNAPTIMPINPGSE